MLKSGSVICFTGIFASVSSRKRLNTSGATDCLFSGCEFIIEKRKTKKSFKSLFVKRFNNIKRTVFRELYSFTEILIFTSLITDTNLTNFIHFFVLTGNANALQELVARNFYLNTKFSVSLALKLGKVTDFQFRYKTLRV